MSELFYKVLEMSIYGSIAILAVLLFRLVFKKCPKRVMILFWIIVALRLVIPFNFNSPTSALNIGKFFAPKENLQETTSYDPETRLREMTVVERAEIKETAAESLPAVTDRIEPAPSYVAEPEPEPVKVTAKDVIPFVWLGVTAGLLIFSAIRYAIFYSKARWSSRSFDGRYYMANNIDPPFVVGIFSPKIFFPINMDDDEREYVLNHEWTHIKNKDGITKLVSYVILCFHWFNPLVWLAFFMLCADIEMRVDEETTSNFNLKMVKEYCKSLVRHAADDNKGAFMQSTAFSGLSFGGMETKIRIKNLLDSKSTSRAVQITSIAVTLVFALLVSAASVDHKPPVRQEPESTEITSDESVIETSGSVSTENIDPGSFVDAYMTLIDNTGSNKANFKYDLVYVDGDQVPELVIEKTISKDDQITEINLYTFKDGKAVPVFEGGICLSSGYEPLHYVPYKDFLVVRVSEEDVESVKENIYTMDGLMNGEAPIREGLADYPVYSIDGVSATMEEFMSVFRPEGLYPLVGQRNYQEITAILKSGIIPAPGGVTAANDTSATPTSTPEPTIAPTEKKLSFDSMADGSVYTFETYENGGYYLEKDNWSVTINYLPSSKVVFNVNGTEIVEDVDFGKFSMPYLLKDNGKVYIYWNIHPNGSGQCPMVRIYNLGDSRITYAGTAENLFIESYSESTECFWCTEYYGEFGVALCEITRAYIVSSNGIPQHADHNCYFGQYVKVKAAKELRGFVVRDNVVTDEPYIVSKGEHVYLHGADEMNYLYIRTTEGVIVKIDITGAYEKYYYRGHERWFYDALLDMFDTVTG